MTDQTVKLKMEFAGRLRGNDAAFPRMPNRVSTLLVVIRFTLRVLRVIPTKMHFTGRLRSF
jgi:hypothetical protein